MTTTTTHDTKRSEDVRARLSLLSEIPDAWGQAVERWSEHNRRYKTGAFPDRNAEYLLYQILVGAWPIDSGRATEYMLKATREAKVNTSWTVGNAAYEDALKSFVVRVLEDGEFVSDLLEFVEPLIGSGRINSLSQALLKLTSPGVPDIYQGNELWDLSLVDPDNRRPVNYAIRKKLLADLSDRSTPEDIIRRAEEGLPKLWVTRQALHLRRDRPELFGPVGAYEPIEARGSKSDHVVAFARGGGCVVVAPRLPLRLGGDWLETTIDLPNGSWRNLLTGEEVPGGEVSVGRLLARFPVALLALDGQ